MHQVAEPFLTAARGASPGKRARGDFCESARAICFFRRTRRSGALLGHGNQGRNVILKATRVDGIYDVDPEKVKDAKRFERISYLDVLQKGLSVMDSTAISLCMDNRMPIIIFGLNRAGNIGAC